MTFLQGKKTYIVAFLMLLVGLINAITGDVAAFQGVWENAQILLTALGLGALRSGVANP
jgi:hypothetical protein